MRIAFLGDVAMVGKYDLQANPLALHRLKSLREYLLGFDLVVANLESPLTSATRTWIPKSMHIRSHPGNVQVLKYLNIGAVSLANNHINDFGRRGIDETIATLEAQGIRWYGVDGRTATVEHGTARITLGGYCCLSTNGTGYESSGAKGIGLLTREALTRQLAEDRTDDALTIFSLHWGREHTHYPNPEHIALMRTLEAEGPFVVHGHHPHVVQGIEKREGSVIAYSLGNCLFDDLESINRRWRLRQIPDNRTSVVLAVEIRDRAVVRHEAVGFKDDEDGIHFCELGGLIAEYSEGLDNVEDLARYELLRQEEASAMHEDKFGQRDLAWLLSRLNYHSIGARIAAAPRQRRYRELRRNGFSR